MSNKSKKYCENRECEHNVLFSCNLYDDVPSYYASSGEFGNVQHGGGAEDNFLRTQYRPREQCRFSHILKRI